jgi:hypothetical protein
LAMSSADPIADLVFLAQAAADAGENWRLRLQRDWLPRVESTTPRALLAAGLAQWHGEPPALDADLGGMIEAAVAEAMANKGYD